MVITPFDFAGTPRIRFGAGRFTEVPDISARFGNTVLLVLGGRSFSRSEHFTRLAGAFRARTITWYSLSLSGEPSPEAVDRAVEEFREKNISVVVAIGGGSVVDAGKAISAMLLQDGSVFEYLEGVGTGKKHDGRKVPFIAVPTTAGTGSEATRNAVLSRVGPGGFKKSLRHEAFVPDYAVVDPELSRTCPGDISAACGMDAFTQLLESYVSAKSSPLTDALALSGMEQVGAALVPCASDGADSLETRASMAYGALLSGITLAHAGLGVVHGLASAIGGQFPIPHGVVCGALLAPANRATIRALRELGPEGERYLEKFARAGRLLSGRNDADRESGCELLLERLDAWKTMFRMPRFRDYGFGRTDIESIAASAGNGNNPVKLDVNAIKEILSEVV
jgi:alcohol dehydrogenase class IV